MTDHGSPAYLTGLLLRGRDVLVVGGGAVATRRVPRLTEAGAHVRVVSPAVTDALRALAEGGQVRWAPRDFETRDVEGAWYVLAATDDPAVNALVARLAEDAHTFCVRVDDASFGSAWTPSTENVGDMTVAVIGNRDPRRSRAVRDAVAAVLRTHPGGASRRVPGIADAGVSEG